MKLNRRIGSQHSIILRYFSRKVERKGKGLAVMAEEVGFLGRKPARCRLERKINQGLYGL